MEWRPDVVCELAAAPLAGAPPGAHELSARPATESEFPHTVTGTLAGALTWLPPAMEWLPDVVCELAAAPLAGAPPGAHELSARPATESEFPHTVTGTLAGALTWLPPAMEWLPDVVCELAAAPLAGAPPGAHELSARPATESEFPHTVTGAFAGALTWLPPAMECLPDVVCELAAAPLAGAPPGAHELSARPATESEF